MSTDIHPFDVMKAPLEGTNLVEASAGTGKTWNIEALTVRLFIEKRWEPADVLVVTFTEAATQELKERIYQRLIQVIRVLKSGEGAGDDLFLMGCLEQYGPGKSSHAGIMQHLENCKQRFDEASISTIHGFCKTVLSEFSHLTRTDIDVTIETEGKGALIEDAVHDFWRGYNAGEATLAGGMLSSLLYGPLSREVLIGAMQSVLRYDEVRIIYPELPFSAGPYPQLPWPASAEEVAGGEAGIAPLVAQLEKLVSEIRYVWENDRENIRQQLADTHISRAGLDKDFEGREAALFAFLDNPAAYVPVGKKLDPEKLGSRFLQEKALKKGSVYRTDHPVHQRIQQALELAAWIPDFEQRRALEVVRRLFRERCARDGVTTFDDLLRNVAVALREDAPENGGTGALHRELRNRYKAGLIDEFQDTDPVQFEIFRRIFMDAAAHAETGGGSEPGVLGADTAGGSDREGGAGAVDAALHGDNELPGRRLLYLIGDPKQAIYQFRGADLRTYMKARELVDKKFTLTRNFRSAANMVDGVNALFEGRYSFIDPGLHFDAATANMQENPFRSEVDAELAGDAGNACGLHFPSVGQVPFTSKDKASRAVISWTAGHIARTLQSARDGQTTGFIDSAGAGGGGESPDKGRQAGSSANQASGGTPEVEQEDLFSASATSGSRGSTHQMQCKPVSAGDIAVLVSSNQQAWAMKKRLESLGVPAVIGGDESVFTSEDARMVNLMLDILVDPQRTALIRTLLTSRMGGMHAAALAELQEDDLRWSIMVEVFATAREYALKRGVLAGLRHITDTLEVEKRLMGGTDGERSITNLRHLTELLYEEQRRSHRNLSGLSQWLRTRRDDPARESSDNTQMRLESDENRVTIMTMHSSKGLQFPVVYAPFLWESRNKSLGLALYYDRKLDSFALDFRNKVTDRRLESQGRSKDEAEAPMRTMDAENMEDRVRLLYVAVTRSKYRCYVPHAMVRGSRTQGTDSPLVAMLLRDPAAGQVQWRDITDFDRSIGLDHDRLIDELLGQLDGHHRFACYEVMPDTDTGYQPGTSDDPLVCRELPAGTFRRMQQHVFVDSYSSLKSSDSGAGDGEESRLRLGEEGNEDARLHPDPRADLYVDSNPVGSDAAGSEPREVPEAFTEIQSFPAGAHTGNFWHDIFETIDFTVAAEIPDVVQRLAAQYGFNAPDYQGTLLAMVSRTLQADLGGFRLGAISRNDTLREMQFYLPYTRSELEAFQRWMGGDPATAGAPDAQYYLTGFIDLLVFHEGRYYILDYKSDKLEGGPDAYKPGALAGHMRQKGYAQQYHYYSLALYLFLRNRLGEVDFDAVFGGVIYLFLRGVGVGETPDNGIFTDRPDPGMIASFAASLQVGLKTVEEQ